jgi:hypothetical protein
MYPKTNAVQVLQHANHDVSGVVTSMLIPTCTEPLPRRWFILVL